MAGLLLIHKRPYTAAIAIALAEGIPSVKLFHLRCRKRVGAHQVYGLAPHNAYAIVGSAVCQHLHDLGEIFHT